MSRSPRSKKLRQPVRNQLLLSPCSSRFSQPILFCSSCNSIFKYEASTAYLVLKAKQSLFLTVNFLSSLGRSAVLFTFWNKKHLLGAKDSAGKDRFINAWFEVFSLCLASFLPLSGALVVNGIVSNNKPVKSHKDGILVALQNGIVSNPTSSRLHPLLVLVALQNGIVSNLKKLITERMTVLVALQNGIVSN